MLNYYLGHIEVFYLTRIAVIIVTRLKVIFLRICEKLWLREAENSTNGEYASYPSDKCHHLFETLFTIDYFTHNLRKGELGTRLIISYLFSSFFLDIVFH